jgi:hypothetical protein
MPHTTWRHRARGAALALLVQVGFLLLLLFSSQRHQAIRSVEHETILLLPPLREISPQTIDARGAEERPVAPIPIPIVPNVAPPVPGPPVLAPPSGIAGFGRSLFGCAPERYADLPPDEKAHCPKPGEGLAVNQPADLLNPPKSHSKDEALWQEQLAERRWMPMCTGDLDVAKCILRQTIAENHRAQAARQKIADDKAAALQEPKRPMPRIGVRRN